MKKSIVIATALAGFATVAMAAEAAAVVPALPAPDWSAVWSVLVTSGAVGYAVTWIAAILPPAQPGTAWGIIRGILDKLAGNVLNAKNAK